MENPKQQIAESIKQANNVLVTVSNNPTVDQLAAAIGFALLLNKLNKHGTAVFSGAIPSTIKFLKPEKTLEKNTDSLRDFIIALDKAKADKLRYKVEDEHVKIFITPYRTSINQLDLQFSQGDFNVDVVVALGVHEQKELDQAITTHGRILHDATVVSVNNKQGANLGSLNWVDEKASSLSEMVAGLCEMVHENPFDGQMATAFLTGIVAETDRFSNEKTSATTMAMSGKLIAAGANQQLVAEELEPPAAPAPAPGLATPMAMPMEAESDLPPVGSTDPNEPPKSADGALLIDHTPEPAQPEEEKEPDLGQIHIDDSGELRPMQEVSAFVGADATADQPQSNMIMEPPTMGGALSAATSQAAPNGDTGMTLPAVNSNSYIAGEPAQGDAAPAADQPPAQDAPASAPEMPATPPVEQQPMEQPAPAPQPAPEAPMAPMLPPEPAPAPQDAAMDMASVASGQTLTQLEESVDSSHLQPPPEVIAPQPADAAPAPDAGSLGLPPVVDPTAAPSTSDNSGYGVQGHKRIEPLPHTEPRLSLPLDPILGDTSVADPAGMPPAVPPPMPGMPPMPTAGGIVPPVSGQVFPPSNPQ